MNLLLWLTVNDGLPRGSALAAVIGPTLQARAGIARAGVTYAGWAPPRFRVALNGVEVDGDADVQYDTFRITTRRDDQQAQCFFSLQGLAPALWQDVQVFYRTPNDWLFAGVLLQASARVAGTTAGTVFWDCAAVGQRWILDRYARVHARYRHTAVNAMVADILARFTDGGFRPGYIPQDLGYLDMDFEPTTTVSEALTRIAKAVDAYWEVRARRRVDLFRIPPEVPPPPVTDPVLENFGWNAEGAQVRTATRVIGGGSVASLPILAGSAIAPVQDTAVYPPAGGTVLSGFQTFTYTGLSIGSGPGDLTGVTGIVDDIASGDPIQVVVEETDAAAVAALAAALGGGLSGLARNVIQSTPFSPTEAAGRAQADLAVFKDPLVSFTFLADVHDRTLRVGRILTVAVPAPPVAIAGEFQIDGVDIVPRGQIDDDIVEMDRHVSASRFTRELIDLLKLITPRGPA